MSLRGVRQLKELIIRYSDYDGSSRGVKEWMKLNLITFANNNPDIKIKAILKRNKHPYLQGIYDNKNTKTIGIKNVDADVVNRFVLDLRNQIGKKV